MMKLKIILMTVLISGSVLAEDEVEVPLIEIQNGLLQGVIDKSYNGRAFSSFEGIPYARPPVDDLRFEAPLEPYDWTGTWIANTKYICLQNEMRKIRGEEDCLYINVYVPKAKPNPEDNLNVIVHIHGGGFYMMDPHSHAGPKYLMDEDVILVTFTYRLGVFGFLSTEDEVLPGNYGLKDQVLALKWIQKNIKHFGGNPDSVTITGMSAGAASVHLHYFSPLSKGLFHRGVSQSGTALAPWVFQETPTDNAKRLAKLVGCPNEDPKEIKVCLQSRSGVKIIESIRDEQAKADNPFEMPLRFTPVIEKDYKGAFLTTHPLALLNDKLLVNDLPWITSVAEGEGLIYSTLLPNDVVNEEVFEKLAPALLYYKEDDNKHVTKKIKEHYFKEHPISKEGLYQVIEDRSFFAPLDISTKLQAKISKSPIYFYIFGYRGEHVLAEVFTFMQDVSYINVASHGDDVLYYLHSTIAEEKLSEDDEKMKSMYLKWLTSFADGKKPEVDNVTWEPVDGSDISQYLYFEKPNEIHRETVEGFGSSKFWRDLPLEENDNRIFIKDEL